MLIAVNSAKASVQKVKKFAYEMTNKDKVLKKHRKTSRKNKRSEADRDP